MITSILYEAVALIRNQIATTFAETKANTNANADAYDVSLTENGRKLWRSIKKASKELDAETMLKYCFIVQMRRVEKLLKLEEKTGLLLPQGYKELAVARNMAAVMRRYEVGGLYINCRVDKEIST